MKERDHKIHPEHKKVSPPKIWKHEYFKEYLLALGRGPCYFEAIKNFPEEIELSDVWHKTFNQLRRETSDGLERYLFIATDQQSHSILLPRNPVTGSEDKISSEDKFKHILWGIEKNIDEGDMIGGMHSHPWGSVFSAGDLYDLVYYRHSAVEGLAGKNANAIAFGTRETGNTDFRYLLMDKSQKDFMNYWYSSNGYKRHGAYLRKIDGSPAGFNDILKIESLIAQRHNLVIYRGEPNQPVKRVYPPV